MDHRQRAVRVRRERVTGRRIVPGTVDAGADRYGGDDFARRGTVLGFPAERDVRDDLSRRRIDHRRRMGIAVESEDPIRGRVINDRVGVFGGGNLAEDRERLEVEANIMAITRMRMRRSVILTR